MKIFIGSSSEQKKQAEMVAGWVEEKEHEPIVWWEIFDFGKYTMETLLEITQKVDAAVFIFGADDKTWYRGNLIEAVRDNVIFEYGLFCGKLSKERVIILQGGKTVEITDLAGITYGKLEAKYQTKRNFDNWIQNMSLNYIQMDNGKRNYFSVMNLSDALNYVFSQCRNFEVLRIYAVSTIKSVQMFRMLDNLKIREARVLLREFSNVDWDREDSMVTAIDNSINNWNTMVKKHNIDLLRLSRFNYHPDRGVYIFDNKFYIEGDLYYFANLHKYEFQNKVIVISANSDYEETWINAKIESFETIYRNYEDKEIIIS